MRLLIFGTVYEADKARADLTDLWVRQHGALNPRCDLLLVDSASPYRPSIQYRHPDIWYWSFKDNIGHAARGGLDGWGRAFCLGLNLATMAGYDYVAHVEGDSLLRLRLATLCTELRRHHIMAAAAIANVNAAWPETGFMVFDGPWLRRSRLTRRYTWKSYRTGHQPEPTLRDLIGSDLTLMPWRMQRDDANQLNVDNVTNYDWISHTTPEIYQRFAELAWSNCSLDAGRIGLTAG